MSFISNPNIPESRSGDVSNSTRFDPATPLHRDGKRPFEPRVFGRREFEKKDVYGFLSIKEKRTVEVEGLPRIAVGLELETNSRVASFVERPRFLTAEGKNAELDFWVWHATGYEEFLLLIPDADCVQMPGAAPRPRGADRWSIAARDAGIHIRLVTEHDVRIAGETIAQNLRLLAFAQVAQTLGNRLALRIRVLSLFEMQPRGRIDQIELALAPFEAADVQAVICELICLGALDFDRGQELTRFSVVTRRTDP